jgi:hypothetical protein
MRTSDRRKRARKALAALTVTAASLVGSLALSPLASAASPLASAATYARVVPASVAAGPVSPVSSAGTSSTTTKPPNTNVEKKGSIKVFVPKNLKAGWSGTTEKKCTTAKQRITISNVTPKAVIVTYNGNALVKLRPDYQFGVCFWGTGVGRFVFGLGRSPAVVTVRVR